jgi:hypothetical protein
MSVSVTYNGTNLSTFGPVFISVSQNSIDYGNKWEIVPRITLNGQIIAKCNQPIGALIKQFVGVFSENYKAFSAGSFATSCAVVDSVNVEDGNAFGIASYTVNIDIYADPTLFSNYYGIIEPQERIEFSDEQDETILLKYIVSAKGLKTSFGAIPYEIAKSWVKQKIDSFSPDSVPISSIRVQTSAAGSNFLLVSQKENIDRFNGTYLSELVYAKSISPDSPSNCFLKYSVNVDYDVNENFLTATINGSLEKNTINNLRSNYNSTNFFKLASNFVESTFNNITLNSKPITSKVTFYENEQKIEFAITYNSDLSANAVNDYTVNIDQDDVTYITTVSINARIFAKYGDQEKKWRDVESFYNSFDGFSLANIEYKKQNLYNKSLNLSPVSESVTFNEKDAEILYNGVWSDSFKRYSDNILNMNINVTYTPSINIYKPLTSAFVSRNHNVQKIGCANFSRLEINTTATIKPSININTVKNEINQITNSIAQSYGQTRGIKETDTISENEESKIITVNQIWEYEGAIIT